MLNFYKSAIVGGICVWGELVNNVITFVKKNYYKSFLWKLHRLIRFYKSAISIYLGSVSFSIVFTHANFDHILLWLYDLRGCRRNSF